MAREPARSTRLVLVYRAAIPELSPRRRKRNCHGRERDGGLGNARRNRYSPARDWDSERLGLGPLDGATNQRLTQTPAPQSPSAPLRRKSLRLEMMIELVILCM